MINLIKNELYKIFHKKGIYVVLIIMLLYTTLTNSIYNSAFLEVDYLEEAYQMELQYIESMETENQISTEEYLYSKIYIAKYEYAKSFGEDSWQRYILTDNTYYSAQADSIINRITQYELIKSISKEEYDKALKEKEALTEELKKLDWKEFLNQEIEDAKLDLANSGSDYEQCLNQARLDTLNLRLKYDIEYRFDEYNDYLLTYQSNHSTELSYQNTDEKTLKEEQKKIRDEAIKEAKLAKYKIENHIKKVPIASNYSILTDFYSEYFIIILVIIVLISGSIVSEEFSKGTIKLLLVKPYTRTKILMSKYITVLLMIIFAIITTLLTQMIIGGLFFGYDSLSIPYVVYNLATKTVEAIPILQYFLISTLVILPQLILLATLCFTLSTLFTSTALANTLTIIGAFGSDIINLLAQSYEIEPLKYFVTLNWDWTVYLFGGTSPYKGVTFPFSIVICLIYLILMISINIIVFKKRNIKNI